MSNNNSRRNAIKSIVTGAAAMGALPIGAFAAEKINSENNYQLKGNINHSVCRWCYNTIPMEDFCVAVKGMGIKAIDLVGPKEWPILQKYGLDSSMCSGGYISIEKGWNDRQYHSTLIQKHLDLIPLVAKAGYKNMICFSGNRGTIDDESGLQACTEGLKQILATAEKHKVTVVMELLNSKVNHKDYMCDKSKWGVELAKRLGSENFKLLYDIYHMQIDEGDVIRTIKENYQYFGHYHTGGVPGRNEIDETQELYYPAIMKAIAATGYKGYVAQEFIPANEDKLASLKNAIRICDV